MPRHLWPLVNRSHFLALYVKQNHVHFSSRYNFIHFLILEWSDTLAWQQWCWFNRLVPFWLIALTFFVFLACEFYHQSNKTAPILIGHGGWGSVSENADNKCTTTQDEMGSDLASSNLHHQHSWKGKMNLCSDAACLLQSIFCWHTFEGSCLTILYLNYPAIPSWDARNQTLILCILKLSA